MSTATCVNPLERFGTDYRVTFEEGYVHKWKRRGNLDPWRMQIPSRFGMIFPAGGSALGVMVDNHNRIARRLAALPCCRLVHDRTREKTFTFDVAHFHTVAAVVLPWRRPKMTEAQKQAAARRLGICVSKIPTSSGVPSAPTHPNRKSDPEVVLGPSDASLRL